MGWYVHENPDCGFALNGSILILPDPLQGSITSFAEHFGLRYWDAYSLFTESGTLATKIATIESLLKQPDLIG